MRGERRVLRFNVLRDQMAGFTSDEPAPGTDDRYRMCVPYPVNLTLSAEDVAADFTLHVAGIADYAYFSPGAPCSACSNSVTLKSALPVQQPPVCKGHELIDIICFIAANGAARLH